MSRPVHTYEKAAEIVAALDEHAARRGEPAMAEHLEITQVGDTFAVELRPSMVPVAALWYIAGIVMRDGADAETLLADHCQAIFAGSNAVWVSR